MKIKTLLCCVLFMAGMAAQAAEYRAVLPWPVGSLSDTIVRKIAETFKNNTGDTIVVDNIPGASGLVGTERWKNGKDAEIYVTTTSSLVADPVTRPEQLNYTDDDFDLVCNIFTGAGVWVTRPDTAIKRPADLLTRLPDLVGGYSPYWDLNTVAMAQHARRPVEIVNYKGTPDILRAIIAKEIDLSLISNGPNVMSLVKAGKIHIVGSTYHADLTLDGVALPSVTRLTGAPGFSSFVGLAIKPGLDPAKAAYLKRELWAAVNTAEVRAIVEASGGIVDSNNNAKQLWQQITSMRERMKKINAKNK